MKRRLLLIEDDRPVLMVTAELLKRTGCEVVAVDSAPAAIEHLSRENFDLVVTDFFLADHTAEEVIKDLRRTHPSVPVIIVTGDMDSVPSWLKEPGVVEQIFSKPYSSSEFLKAVGDAFQSELMATAGSAAATPETTDFCLPKGVADMVHRVVDEESIVAITDKKGAIVYANDRFCEISGFSRSELLGRNHRLLKSGQHPPAFYKSLWSTILSGRVWRGEICNKAKDGHLYHVDTIISPLRTEGLITHFLALRTDITAKKEIEKELAQRGQREEEERRMVALGRMANGFLHDLSNVLTGVMGLVTEVSSAARDEMLNDAIGRMAQLTRTLRDYSVGRPAKVEPFLLNPLIACACSLVRHRKGVPALLSIVELTAATRKVEVIGCEAQIFEVVLNLVVNAMEAAAAVPAPKVVVQSISSGRNVVITVEDNGPGVAHGIAGTLFDPYTSSKGEGRGIGLSVSRSIASAHGGTLLLESAGGGGKGARFRLSLPARESALGNVIESETPVGAKRVVLVSEDEADVRRQIVRSAGEIGLTVLNAGDTADLLALAVQMKEVLAAAIIDSCEVESERGAVACLRRIAPDLPIILISAKLTTRGRSTTPWGIVENIPKPFEREDLRQALSVSVSQPPFN